MSVEAFALSFFDPDRELYGTARSGATLLFHGREPAAHADGPEVTEDGEGWRAELAERLSLRLEPVSPEADLEGVTARICRVTGEVDGTNGRLPRDVLDHLESPRTGRSSRPCAASPPWWTRAAACWRSPAGRATRPATATSR